MCWRAWFNSSFRLALLLAVSAGMAGRAIVIAGDSDNPFATEQEKIAAAAKARTWSDRNGKFSVEATLVKIDDGKVVLKRKDGQEITVSLDKLSDADQKYVVDLRGKISPAVDGKSAANGESAATGASPGAKGDESPSVTKLPLAVTDYRTAKSIDLSGAGAWSYKPDVASGGDKLPAVRIPLKPVDFFDHLQRVLLLPKEKKAFAVFYNDFKTHTSLVQACNLQSGQLDAAAVFGEEESPIDISPDGTMVLSKQESNDALKRSELHLYTREGNKVKPLKGWRPYVVPAGSDDDHFNTAVTWASFTDPQHLLTYGDCGKLVLWEVPSLKPIWSAAVAGEPSFSAGRQYAAVQLLPSNSRASASLGHSLGKPASEAYLPTSAISILNVADGAEVAHISLDEWRTGSISISPDGTRLALGQLGRLRVWNLQTQELWRDFAVQRGENPVVFVDAKWTSNQHVLSSDGVLVDVERRAPIWKYNLSASAVCDGKVWFVEQTGGRDASVLASMEVPHPAAVASVANLKPDDLLVVRPGMEVALDCQLTGNPDEVDAAKKVLEARLQKNGMKLVPDSTTRLIATVQPGKTVTIHYRPFSRFPTPFSHDEGTPYQTNTQVVSLKLQIDGKTVWKYESSTSPPSLLHLKEGESVEQALQAAMKLQEDTLPKRCTSVWIPAYISRVPGEGDANNNGEPKGTQKSRGKSTRPREA